MTYANTGEGEGLWVNGNPVGAGPGGGLSYQGLWDANANNPPLASGVGTNGHYYVVSVAGNTNLDGITDWQPGDWAIFNGTAWQKIDNTDQVSSVFGRQGAVVAAAGDYDADQVDFDPSAVWLTAADVQAALEELAVGEQFALRNGRNNANVTMVYLRGPNGTPSNLSGLVLPWDATITAISAKTLTAKTWTAEVRKNGAAAVIASLSLTAVAKDSDKTLSVNVNEGDEIQTYANGTSLDYPTMTVWIRRRS